MVLFRYRRNTNASQSAAEGEERPKSNRLKKPQDDETIVKSVLNSIVNRVVRRSTLRNRPRKRTATKDATENAAAAEQVQTRSARRGGKGRRGGRTDNGYFLEQGTVIRHWNVQSILEFRLL